METLFLCSSVVWISIYFLLDLCWSILEQKPREDPKFLSFHGDLSLDLVSEISFRRLLILAPEGTRFSFVFHKNIPN